MIIDKAKKGNIMVYHVDKNIDDNKMEGILNTYVKPSQIDFIIDHDADVYTKDNKLLLRFRKGKLSSTNVANFYDNVIKFAKHTTSNRGSTSGSKKKNVGDNPKIMSNIFGFFDKFSPSQKALLSKKGKKYWKRASADLIWIILKIIKRHYHSSKKSTSYMKSIYQTNMINNEKRQTKPILKFKVLVLLPLPRM